MPQPAEAVLTTERLVLEPLAMEHADLLFDGLRDPALYTFIPQDPPADVAAKREHFARILRGPQGQQGEVIELWRNWAVKVSATSTYIGLIETSVHPGAHAHLAYFIFANAQRTGYAKEACTTVLKHLAAAYSIKHVVTEMDTRNTASWRLVESLGFTRIGEKKDADFFKGATSHEYLYRLDLTTQAY